MLRGRRVVLGRRQGRLDVPTAGEEGGRPEWHGLGHQSRLVLVVPLAHRRGHLREWLLEFVQVLVLGSHRQRHRGKRLLLHPLELVLVVLMLVLMPLVVRPLASVLAAVPPVLDGVVAAAITQPPGDLGPLLADFPHKLLDQVPLRLGDGIRVEAWSQVLVVPLPALLGRPPLDLVGDADPVQRARALHEVQEKGVLLRVPRPPSPRRSLVVLRHLRDWCVVDDAGDRSLSVASLLSVVVGTKSVARLYVVVERKDVVG